jgi:hypothetical protein
MTTEQIIGLILTSLIMGLAAIYGVVGGVGIGVCEASSPVMRDEEREGDARTSRRLVAPAAAEERARKLAWAGRLSVFCERAWASLLGEARLRLTKTELGDSTCQQ